MDRDSYRGVIEQIESSSMDRDNYREVRKSLDGLN